MQYYSFFVTYLKLRDDFIIFLYQFVFLNAILSGTSPLVYVEIAR
jgi:hypothetical protein